MNIQISKEAAAWYIEELGLTNGDYVRFFARYGGCSNVQSGFSLGIESEEPINLAVKKEVDGITFYIEEKDEWYFDEHDLVIELPDGSDEPVIDYKKQSTPEV